MATAKLFVVEYNLALATRPLYFSHGAFHILTLIVHALLAHDLTFLLFFFLLLYLVY